MNGRFRHLAGLVAAVLVVAGLLVVSTGCGADRYSRSLEFTHWHDDETIVLVYSRERTTEGLFAPFRSEPETVHVRICSIAEDNTISCRHQSRATNMLNPHAMDGDLELRDRWEP